MIRTVDLALNKFPVTPLTLRADPASGPAPKSDIDINLAALYHHYYLDTYGVRPPDPDPANFEYLRFLLPTKEFRLIGDGIGVTKQAKIHGSSSLGQAFCRLFLHDHLDITYFAHVEDVLGQAAPKQLGSLRLQRIATGDVPDYLCTDTAKAIYLAEAKGRYRSISFGSVEFASWRKQFGRVSVVDEKDQQFSVKGYAVGTRFATEMDSSRIRTTLFAEDPRSPGEVEIESSDRSPALSQRVLESHYANIAGKLRQPLLAAALATRSHIPDEIQVIAPVWEFQVGPLKKRRFVGGIFGEGGSSLAKIHDEAYEVRRTNPWEIGSHPPTFFGVEETIFRNVIGMARGNPEASRAVKPLDELAFFYSAVSVLRDGSLLAPVDFLRLAAVTRF